MSFQKSNYSENFWKYGMWGWMALSLNLNKLGNQNTQRQTVANAVKPRGRCRQSTTAKESGLCSAFVNIQTVLMNAFMNTFMNTIKH